MKNKIEYTLTAVTMLASLISWAFSDTFDSLDKEYFIPIKAFICFIVFIVCTLTSLTIYIIIQKRKIEDLTRLTPLENYDVLCDSQGNKYCPYHKTTVTHSGPYGYAEDSFWCPTCEKWFEKKGSTLVSTADPWII